MKQRVWVVVALSVMLVGCKYLSGGGATTARKLVTSADAERILGSAVRLESSWDGQADTPPYGRESRCEYVGAGRATLNAVIDTAPSEDGARGAFAESRAGLGSFEHVEEVSGIGDEAFFSRGPSSRRLIVRKKAVVFLIDARRDDGGEPSVDEMKKTAARVADQL